MGQKAVINIIINRHIKNQNFDIIFHIHAQRTNTQEQ